MTKGVMIKATSPEPITDNGLDKVEEKVSIIFWPKSLTIRNRINKWERKLIRREARETPVFIFLVWLYQY